MQLLLTSIDYCNIGLSTSTPMLQHTGLEVFDIPANAESVTLKIHDT